MSSPPREWTLSEVQHHASVSDCWLIISGRVYDVTDFLARHPAGGKIVQMHGGRDCTAAFLDVHRERYLTQFLPAVAFKGVVAGSGAKAHTDKFVGQYWTPDQVLSIKRTVYTQEHEEYRQKFKEFISKHIHPVYASWESGGQPDVDVLRSLVHSDGGFYLRLSIPRQFGGLGLTDWRYHAVITEELENSDIGSFFLNLGNDMVLSYFTKSATPAQQARWLPKIVNQGCVIAIAMSEPEVGSDLATLATTAKRTAEGWVLNGRKMWISAGATADIVVISAVTDASKGAKGISLFAVERGTEGFESAKRFAKLGKHASDTCLLTLENVRIPLDNLIGLEGEGFKYMMGNLSKERLSIAVGSAAAARRALSLTLNYVHGREMFGGVLGQLQSVAQKLAALRTDIQVVTTFVDSCIAAQAANELSAETASMAKVAATELSNRVADACLQMFGGYGYLKNNPVGKIFVDQRVTKIYGGANEVLLEVIGKGLGFKPQRMYRAKL